MKDRLYSLLALYLLVLTGTQTHAQDPHIIERYGQADMPVIRAKVSFTTLIQLRSEDLSEVSCGDSVSWVIESKGSRVYVKPVVAGVSTNLNIVTKRNLVYSFVLREVSDQGSKERVDLRVVIGSETEEGGSPSKKAQTSSTGERPVPTSKPADTPRQVRVTGAPKQHTAEHPKVLLSPPSIAVERTATVDLPTLATPPIATVYAYERKASQPKPANAILRFFRQIARVIGLS